MNPVVKALWLTALRSKKFLQGKGVLRRKGTGGVIRHCCLGVLGEEAVKAGIIPAPEVISGTAFFDDNSAVLSYVIQSWAGLDDNNPLVYYNGGRYSLAELNDGAGDLEPLSFDQIADLIEAQL